MELQQIIVFAIVLFSIVLAGIRIYHYFKKIEDNGNPCEGCNSDCSLKSLHNKQKCDCEKNADK